MYDEFLKITGYNIENYFRRFIDFINNKSQNIIDYYSGLTPTLNRDSFGEYEYLLKESDFVINIFDLNLNRFNTVDYWEFMEFADDIKIKLETIGVFNKYTRSSVDKESFSNNISIDIASHDNETIEQLISNMGSTNRDEDWVNVALSNVLIQEDYSNNGGKILTVNFKSTSTTPIESIVDSSEGEKIKGRDILKKITFENEDLKVLEYDDTLQQMLDIMLNLSKNDNPEFPEYGIDKTLVLGMTYKAIALPSILRQLFQTLSTEDIISDVQVLKTNFDQDSLFMDLSINVKSGQNKLMTLNLNGN